MFKLITATVLTIATAVSAEGAPVSPVIASYTAIEPFTGRVAGNKVRLRAQPDLGGQIVSELDPDAFLVVQGEYDDFFAVAPPEGMKAYVYRPFVLDNTIEGAHVNVRLAPDVDAPILTQLNTGDQVKGEVCAANPKWMEIDMPAGVCLYVARDYLTKVGGADMLAQRASREAEVAELLSAAYALCQSEMRKPYEKIDFAAVNDAFSQIVANFPDFPECKAKAEAIAGLTEELYMQKKLAFLNEKESEVCSLEAEIAASEQLLMDFDADFAFGEVESIELAFEEPEVEEIADLERDHSLMTDQMIAWETVEQHLHADWAVRQESDSTLRRFYDDQELEAVTLTGIVQVFDRPVSNRPGDYVLRKGNRPIAYLYSADVNLEEFVGDQVTIKGFARPNHHFAYPAYFVASAERD